MKKFTFLFSILFLSFQANSQEFVGVVKDKSNRSTIPFATIYFLELQTGTVADENGEFSLENLPNNKLKIQITSVGYKSKTAIINIAKKGKKTFFLEESLHDLKEVFLVAPKGKLQTENSLQIVHKSIKELQQTASVSLAEAITNIAGVSQISTGAGIGKPVIRGLSGNRIVTYAQGIRMENQQWGGEHGLGIGDVGIESVEVIKGPSSLLYGSDALGGVLYFIDALYAKPNRVESFVSTNFQSNTLASLTSAGIKYHKKNFKWNLFSAYNSHADYKTPNNDRVFNSRFDEANIKGAFGYSKDNWISHIKYSFLQNNFGIIEADEKYGNGTKRNFEIPYQEIKNHALSFENTFLFDEAKINAVLGYTGNRRKEFEHHEEHEEHEEEEHDEHEEEGAALNMNLETYTYNIKWFSPTISDNFEIILGSQGMHQTNTNSGEELLIPDAVTKDFGIFSVLHWDLESIQLQGGLRRDYRKIETSEHVDFEALTKTFKSTNYSLGVVYPFDKLILKANFSAGFRAPNTSELIANGVHHGTSQYVKGNSVLKSEKAKQFDVSLNYNNDHLSLSFNPYLNKINNYIYLSPTGTNIEDNPVFEYLQNNATLYGGELGIHFHPHNYHWLHLESTLATVYAEDDDKNALPLIPATKINSSLKIAFEGERKFQIESLFLNHIYNFEQTNIGLNETESPKYQLVNLGMNFKIASKETPLKINTGIKNIFNTKYIDHLSRLKTMDINNQGINFYLGLTINLEHKLTRKK
ncbi:TonB-dependent receptor [Flavicella sediminum]|uniref:TonB-dependent receptor n=1 Tax=Flavicella sediminum TaxID=2585141 RepID=UPI00111E868B|nr:TonB-dependent receptor [Flavicella sediminum]